MPRSRKVVLFLASLALACFAVWLGKGKLQEKAASSLPATAAPMAHPAPLPLKEASLSVAESCLGRRLEGPHPLEAFVENISSLPGSERILWKVVRAEANGKEVRLRLSLEPGESGQERFELRIFTVDAEGLPDLLEEQGDLSQEPEARMKAFLQGKRILSEVESVALVSPSGPVQLEREDGRIVQLEMRGAKGRLACAGRVSLECRCL